jgi:hypothetical protein
MNSESDKQKDKRLSLLLRAVEKNTAEPNREFMDKLREKSTAEFLTYSANDRKNSQTKTPFPIWRIIMKNNITKLAAAAVIIIGIMLVINYLGTPIDGSSVAWGEVVKKLEDIHTYSFRKRRLETTDPQKNFESGTETKVYYSAEYGEWTESFRNGHLHTRTYALLKERTFTGIVPLAKIYDRHSLSDAEIREMEQMMPRQVVMRFLESDYKALGSEVIDGVKVEKVEVHDPKILNPNAPPLEDFVARLAVNVETELPVNLELEFIVGDKNYTKMIFDQFQWNIKLDASDFEPNIPDDYTTGQLSNR